MKRTLLDNSSRWTISFPKCWRDTTRQCQGSLPKYEGVSDNAIAMESECSVRRRLMEAALRDQLRIALRRRASPARWLKEDLMKRLLRGRGAQALTEEAVVALLFVRRRLASRPGDLAWIDDAGAMEWIFGEVQGEVGPQRWTRGDLGRETLSTRLSDLG